MSRDTLFITTYIMMMIVHVYRQEWFVGIIALIVFLMRIGVPI